MGLDIYIRKHSEPEEVGYFRKVNFLVRYFESLGYRCENCGSDEINKEDVLELIDRCEKILENHDKAEELLPTVSGFFFGNTEYNEYYYGDVEDVLKFCKEELIPEFDNLKEGEFITFEIDY